MKKLVTKLIKESWQLLFFIPFIIVFFFICLFFYDIISKGLPSLSWEFLTTTPRENMTQGGIFPAIYGTFMVTIITTLISAPLGIFTAIYLSEYTKSGLIISILRISIRNLAGVPSIVYGLFGLFLFVGIFGDLFGLRPSILASGMTLGILTLPWIITASEEALKNVPQSYREGSLALGATKWQSIYTNVIPPATPGIMTGIILGISRAAGETAPILFTGAAYSMAFQDRSPLYFFQPDVMVDSLVNQFMALPYHLFIMVMQHPGGEKVLPLAYGTALTLLLLVVLLNVSAMIIRGYMRYRYRVL